MQTAPFSPSDVAELIGWKPDGQRDMRAKGYISNYGTQTSGGHWKYSNRDLMAFWIASHLHEGKRHNLHELFVRAWHIAPTIIEAVRGNGIARYFVVGWEAAGDTKGGGGTTLIGMIDAIDGPDLNGVDVSFDVAEVIDLRRLAEAVPAGIRDIITREGEAAD